MNDLYLARDRSRIAFHRGQWCPYSQNRVLARAEDQAVCRAPPHRGKFAAPSPELRCGLKIRREGAVSSSCRYWTTGYPPLGLAIYVGDEMKHMMVSSGWDPSATPGHRNGCFPNSASFIVGTDGIVHVRSLPGTTACVWRSRTCSPRCGLRSSSGSDCVRSLVNYESSCSSYRSQELKGALPRAPDQGRGSCHWTWCRTGLLDLRDRTGRSGSCGRRLAWRVNNVGARAPSFSGVMEQAEAPIARPRVTPTVGVARDRDGDRDPHACVRPRAPSGRRQSIRRYIERHTGPLGAAVRGSCTRARRSPGTGG